MTGKQLYLRLLTYLKPYMTGFSGAIGFIVLFALTEPILPYLMQPLMDGNFSKVNARPLYQIPLAIVILFIVRGILHFCGQYLMSWVSQKVVMDLRNEMFYKLTLLPAKFFNRERTGNLISRFTYNVSQVAEASTDVLVILVRDSITILGLLLFLIYTSWKLSLFILIVAPIVAVLIRIVSRRLRQLSHGTQDSMGRITHILEEAINGSAVMKIFAGHDYERSRFKKVSNSIRRFFVKTVSTSAASVSIIQLFNALAVSMIIYFALLQSQADNLSAGEFVSFLGALAMMWPSIKRITEVNVKLQKGLAAAESVFALVDEEHEQDTGELELQAVKGKIEIENVNFQYPEKDNLALKNVSLTINPGQTVALVGESGSGKSTLIRLMPRLFESDSGQIKIDGSDIKKCTLKSLRQQISYVSQDISLFNDTAFANIAYGSLQNATHEEVVQAAKQAKAYDFIMKLPDKFNTNIGSDGVLLSGGQRQRIAIARALLKKSPILILDEATSALDQILEQEIKDILKKTQDNRTVIIVTHRLSSIKDVDMIYLFNEGVLEASGTHSELLVKSTLYNKMFNADIPIS